VQLCEYTANAYTPLAVVSPFLFIQRVLGPIPDRWLDLLALSGEAAVPQWLFTNWTLVRQHTSKQVPCSACCFFLRSSAGFALVVGASGQP
jgi:hypothetical protein